MIINELARQGDTIEWTLTYTARQEAYGKIFRSEVIGLDETYSCYNVMVDYGWGKQQDKIPYSQAKVINRIPVGKKPEQSTNYSNINDKIVDFVKNYLTEKGYKPVGDPVFNYPFLAADGSMEINLEPVLEDFADDLLNSDLSDQFDMPELWIKYNWSDWDSRPKNPGRYWVYRKNHKAHYEQWNGTGWAYNNNDILYWMHEPAPPLELQTK